MLLLKWHIWHSMNRGYERLLGHTPPLDGPEGTLMAAHTHRTHFIWISTRISG